MIKLNAISRVFRSVFLVAAVFAVDSFIVSGQTAEPSAEQNRSSYELLDIPKTRWPGFTDMVIDSSGTIWIMANKKVFYLDGDEFKEPMSDSITSGLYLTMLYGGPQQGAYATQRGKSDHSGNLYRLDKGHAELLTTFYYDSTGEHPGVYISKNGRIFNWGKRFLSFYNGKDWTRIEVSLASRRPLNLHGIFDLGQDVYFYHDDSLYCITAEGKIEPRECPKQKYEDNNRIIGVLWGKQRALVIDYGEPGLFSFDLISGEEIDLSNMAYKDVKFYDAFSLKNGDVMIMGKIPNYRHYSFFVLSVDGQLSEVPALRVMKWDNTRFWQFPESVLETSKGEIIFGLKKDGIAVLDDGKLNHLNWQYGFFGGVRHLHEDMKGNIYFPVNEKVARLHLGDDPLELDSSFVNWEEFSLTVSDRCFLETKTGQLAMFRKDKKGYMSRWDGLEWSHQKVPFDTDRLGRFATDDRGHVLLNAYSHPDGYYDVGPDSIKRFDKIESMVKSAVDAGAREFSHGIDYQGFVVTPEKRIWFGFHNYNSVMYHDGIRWDTLSFRDDVYYLFDSIKHGVLIRTQGGKFYRYDRGQMIEVEPPLQKRQLCMINGKGLQPYEKKLFDAYPGKYFPVFVKNGKKYLFVQDGDFEASVENEDYKETAAFTELPRYTDRISASRSGGGWIIDTSSPKMASRLFGDEVYRIDITETPLHGRRIYDVKEDAAGGLWFLSENGRQVFHCKTPHIKLLAEPVEEKCRRQFAVKVSVVPKQERNSIRFFSRVNNGQWKGATLENGKCLFQFSKSGKYNCQIIGLWMGARLKSDISFEVQADVELPETIVTVDTDKEVLVDTFLWKAPVAVKNPKEDSKVVFYWRVKGQDKWSVAKDLEIDISDMKEGEHTIEFYAEEDGLWRDMSPVEINIRLAPDLEKNIDLYLQKMISGDSQQRSDAHKRLLALDEKGVLVLEKRLKESEEAAKLARSIRQVLSQLRQQMQTDGLREN